jgi:hypothetical protein
MSYSRFGADGSDVYTFPSDSGLECCACHLMPGPFGRSFTTRDLDEFAAHLDAHRAAGDHVPDDVMPEIRRDLDWLIAEGMVTAPPDHQPAATTQEHEA